MGGLLALILTAGAQAEDVTTYVPFVRILSSVIPGDAGKAPSYVYWASRVAAYNNSASPATISTGDVYGPGPFCLGEPTVIPPHSGIEMVTLQGGCAPVNGPGTGPDFLVLTASPSVVVGADVQRIVFVAECGGGVTIGDPTPNYNIVSQGTAPLPVYKGLMPANSTAVAGPIDLGALDHPETCITGPLTRRRRVNVTLLNGGVVGAAFTVIGRSPRARADALFQISGVLRPLETRQLNAIPLPISQYHDYLQLTDGYDIRIWLNVTATQPFLAYVTTIFEDGEPGTNAFTVYEARGPN